MSGNAWEEDRGNKDVSITNPRGRGTMSGAYSQTDSTARTDGAVTRVYREPTGTPGPAR